MVSSDGAIQREDSRPSPAAHGLGTDPKEVCDLGRRQEAFRRRLLEELCRQILPIGMVREHMGIVEQDVPLVPGQMEND